MVLPKRIHYPGLIYHVINRGNNRQACFPSAKGSQVKAYYFEFDKWNIMLDLLQHARVA